MERAGPVSLKVCPLILGSFEWTTPSVLSLEHSLEAPIVAGKKSDSVISKLSDLAVSWMWSFDASKKCGLDSSFDLAWPSSSTVIPRCPASDLLRDQSGPEHTLGCVPFFSLLL